MGWLGDLLGSAGDWVKDKTEKVKDYIIDKVEETVDKMRDIASDLLDIITGETSSESSYVMEESDVITTERLNNILKGFSEEYMKNAVTIEEACIEAVQKYYEHLMPIIEQSESVGYSKASINRLKKNQSNMCVMIGNSIRQPLSKRLSLDDAECLEILKMEAGRKKKNEMRTFTKKVIGEATNNLADTVREVLDMQLNDLGEGLWEVAEKREVEFSNLKEAFDRFAASNSEKMEDREVDCVLPMFILSVTDEVLQLIA